MEQTITVALEDMTQFIEATNRQLSELIDNIGLDRNQLFAQVSFYVTLCLIAPLLILFSFQLA